MPTFFVAHLHGVFVHRYYSGITSAAEEVTIGDDTDGTCDLISDKGTIEKITVFGDKLPDSPVRQSVDYMGCSFSRRNVQAVPWCPIGAVLCYCETLLCQYLLHQADQVGLHRFI